MRQPNTTAACAGILLMLFVNVASLRGEPWYLNQEFSCSDPFTIIPSVRATWTFLPLHLHIVAANKSLGYVEVPKEEYDRISGSQPEVEEKLLRAENAQAFRSIFATKSNDVSTPGYVNALLTVVSAYFVTSTQGIFLGALFSYLDAHAQSSSTTAAILSNVIAEGGKIQRVLIGHSDEKKHENILEVYVYKIQIGSESRDYVIAACQYPVRINFMEFLTQAEINNLSFRYNSSEWREFSLDENAYQGSYYSEFDRDDEYVYFREKDTNPPEIYRISMHGGLWQRKNNTNSWGTLYSKVVAK